MMFYEAACYIHTLKTACTHRLMLDSAFKNFSTTIEIIVGVEIHEQCNPINISSVLPGFASAELHLKFLKGQTLGLGGKGHFRDREHCAWQMNTWICEKHSFQR